MWVLYKLDSKFIYWLFGFSIYKNIWTYHKCDQHVQCLLIMLFETRDIADLFNTTFFIGCCGMNLIQPWNISLLGLESYFFSLTGDQYLPFIHYSEVTQSWCYIFLYFFLWFFFKLLSWKLFSRFVFGNNLFVFGSFLCLSYVVRE